MFSLDKTERKDGRGQAVTKFDRKDKLTVLVCESRRLVDPRMNIGLLLDFRIRGIPNVTRRALGMAKRTVDSKQGVRSNDRNGDRGPQPSLEWPQKCSMVADGFKLRLGVDQEHVASRR